MTKTKEALGMVEVHGLTAAIEIADAMVKAANVHLDKFVRTKGKGWMTVRVYGDVGAVNAAVDCGKHLAAEKNKLISSKVIPRPIENIFGEEPTESSGQEQINSNKKMADEKQAESIINPEEERVEGKQKTEEIARKNAKKIPEKKKTKKTPQ